MGSADVVPGVSGGTMAYILGIYQRLVTAISRFDRNLLLLLINGRFKEALVRADGVFLLTLFFGIASALLFFTRIVSVPDLLHSHPEPVYGLFFGLVLGSLVLLSRQLGRHKARDWIFLIIGLVAGWLVVTMVPVQTPDAAWFLFLSGSLAICAMLLPGISGSFVLLMLHQYERVFRAVGAFDFALLLPFILGCITGALVFSRLLSWLLEQFLRPTCLFINGVLVASLWVIWPFQFREYQLVGHSEKLVSSHPIFPPAGADGLELTLAMVFLGVALVLILAFLASSRQVQAGP